MARSLIEVPEPRETAAVALPDGAEIVVRRHGRRDGPRLLMSHGNGFAADMYYPMWGRLAEDFDVVLFDLRNHGWNAVGDINKHNLPQFAADIDFVTAEVGRCFGEKRTLGVFHSVSALAVCVSHSRGKHYAGLFLLDPPFCQPGKTYAEFDEATEKLAVATRRRQFRFRSFEESLPLHRLFLHRCAIPGAADLMARTILREADDGDGVVLRCPREYEALLVEYAHPVRRVGGLWRPVLSRKGARSRSDTSLLVPSHFQPGRHCGLRLRLRPRSVAHALCRAAGVLCGPYPGVRGGMRTARFLISPL